jgi:GGDEF domain-containing protein
MSDIKKIAEAIAALVNATSACYVTVTKYSDDRAGISFAHNSDADARQAAGALGVSLKLVGNTTAEWLSGDVELSDALTVNVYGPHHARATSPKVNADAALAQAKEALS